MQIGELLSRQGSNSLHKPAARVRVEAALPATGYSIGPPQAEDHVEISALACSLLRASEQLEVEAADKVGWIHREYMRGEWPLDEEGLAKMFLANPVLARALGYQPPPAESANGTTALARRGADFSRESRERSEAGVRDGDTLGLQIQGLRGDADEREQAASAAWFDV